MTEQGLIFAWWRANRPETKFAILGRLRALREGQFVMKKFENALDVSPLDDGKNWVVLEDFYYDTDIRLSGPSPSRVVALKGFQTDFASIPRPLWTVVGAPTEGKYRKIAVIHDVLYRVAGLATRSEADSVLLEGMKVSGVNWWTRWQVYLGVRVGGSSSYKGGL